MLKGRIPLVIAAVFALLAGMVAYLAVQRRGSEISQRWEPVPVLVARDRLAPGAELGPENLQRGLMPRALVTKSVVTLDDHQRVSVFGRKLALPMEPGDMLLYTHVLTKTGEQHMADAVQQRGRAVSIRVSPESAVHHWIEPADRVDVIGVLRDPKSGELISMTMLQNVIVLATGRIGGQTNRRLLTDTEQAYDTVTVHVLPEAAEMLVLAQDLGTLYLTLRNPEDNDINEVDSKTTMQTLVTGERAKRLSTTQSKIFKVEIIRGRRSETQMIP
jgi:pilus assembly protein CpaB